MLLLGCWANLTSCPSALLASRQPWWACRQVTGPSLPKPQHLKQVTRLLLSAICTPAEKET
jgi:hypothetical protein